MSGKVQCSHAGANCGKCPHKKPHKVHRPLQTEWDNKDPCTKPTFCETAMAYCRCEGYGDEMSAKEAEQ